MLPTTPQVLCKFHLLDNWQIKAGSYGIKELLSGDKPVYKEFWSLLRGMIYFDLGNEYTLGVIRDILEEFVITAREKNMDRHSYLENYWRNYIDKIYLNEKTRHYRPEAVSGNLYHLMLDANYVTSTGDAEASHKQINSLFDNIALSKK